MPSVTIKGSPKGGGIQVSSMLEVSWPCVFKCMMSIAIGTYHGRVLLSGLLSMACSACFPIEPRTTISEMAPFTMDWGLPPLITNCENALQQDFMEVFLQLRLLAI